MSKVKKKKNDVDFYNGINVKKMRTGGTVGMVLECIKGLSVLDNFDQIFFLTDTPVKELITKNIQDWLIEAELQPDKFRSMLHTKMKKLTKEILRMKGCSDYLELTIDTLEQLDGINGEIQNAYYDLLMQIGTYLISDKGCIAGCDGNKLLEIPSMYPYVDVDIHYFAHIKGMETDEFNKALKKRGYELDGYTGIKKYLTLEQTMMNQFFSIASFINKNNFDFVNKGLPITSLSDVNYGEAIHTQNDVNSALEQRKRLLPSNGIIIQNYRQNTTVRYIQLFESFNIEKNRKYLVYKISHKEHSVVGFKNLNTGFVDSTYRANTDPNIEREHWEIVSYINELYALLTSDLNLEFELEEIESHKEYKSRTTTRKFTSRKLSTKATEVEAYIRKLPLGQNASDEAIKLAERYGIILSANETFISSYIRNSEN